MEYMVKSHRQEKIDTQLEEIESVLNKQENIFEPGKQVELDKSYTGDQFEYQFQKEEKDL